MKLRKGHHRNHFFKDQNQMPTNENNVLMVVRFGLIKMRKGSKEVVLKVPLSAQDVMTCTPNPQTKTG